MCFDPKNAKGNHCGSGEGVAIEESGWLLDASRAHGLWFVAAFFGTIALWIAAT
ncbi:MAG: hypothetical protein WC003_03375 [Terrimicrobiaceae bacterium]